MKQLGVIVPIVTPCNVSGDPDIEQLKVVCDDMLDAGCHGIFVLGSTRRGPCQGEVILASLPGFRPRNHASQGLLR